MAVSGDVEITKVLVRKLVKFLSNQAVFLDNHGRQYLEMPKEHLQKSEMRNLDFYKDDNVHGFYYMMPINSKNPRTQEAVPHPHSNETGGQGIEWVITRISQQMLTMYPTIREGEIRVHFLYSHHSTKKQAKARAGFVVARIAVLDTTP